VRAPPAEEVRIVEPRTLACEGRMVAAVELADTYGYDTDGYDHVFLFRRAAGYELLVVARSERYREDGGLDRAAARVDITSVPSVTALENLVDARWPRMSDAWWKLLDRGREEDPDLHTAWVPERMRRDLDQASVYDKRLATTTAYFSGRDLDATGRKEPGWKEGAVDSVVVLLTERGWTVRPGPELAPDVEPGGILSIGTEVAGSLWAERYGQEVALIIRVDDCGEIYPRLAEADDLLYQRPALDIENLDWWSREAATSRGDSEPVPVGDAIHELLHNRLGGVGPGCALEL
jgi:hypothetical protein